MVKTRSSSKHPDPPASGISPSVSNSPASDKTMKKEFQKNADSSKSDTVVVSVASNKSSDAKPVYTEIVDFNRIKKGFNKKLQLLKGVILYVDTDWRLVKVMKTKIFNFVVANDTGDIMITLYSGGRNKELDEAELNIFNKTIQPGTNVQLTFSPGQLKWVNQNYNKGSIQWSIVNPLYSICNEVSVKPKLRLSSVSEIMAKADGDVCDAMLYVVEDVQKEAKTSKDAIYSYRQLLLADTTGNLTYILNSDINLAENKVIVLKNCTIRVNNDNSDIKYLNGGYMVHPKAAGVFDFFIRDFLRDKSDFKMERMSWIDKTKYNVISLRKIRQKGKEFMHENTKELPEKYKKLVVEVKFIALNNHEDYVYYSKKGDKKRRSISPADIPENSNMEEYGERNIKFNIVVADMKHPSEKQQFVLFEQMIGEFLDMEMNLEKFENLSPDDKDALFNLENFDFRFYLNTYIKEYNGKYDWRFNVVAIERTQYN